MPIKPENKKLYPKNWQEIRKKILERAKNKCEFCGVENHAVGFRCDGLFVSLNNAKRKSLEENGVKLLKIVLTIAHLDHNPQNNNPENLRALCQKCHNNYDIAHRAKTRRKTRELKLKKVFIDEV